VDRRFGNGVSDGRTIILSRCYSPIRPFSSFSSNSRRRARADVVAKDLGINRSLVFTNDPRFKCKNAKIWLESDPVYDLTAIDMSRVA
jgi:hypothetical protein